MLDADVDHRGLPHLAYMSYMEVFLLFLHQEPNLSWFYWAGTVHATLQRIRGRCKARTRMYVRASRPGQIAQAQRRLLCPSVYFYAPRVNLGGLRRAGRLLCRPVTGSESAFILTFHDLALLLRATSERPWWRLEIWSEVPDGVCANLLMVH